MAKKEDESLFEQLQLAQEETDAVHREYEERAYALLHIIEAVKQQLLQYDSPPASDANSGEASFSTDIPNTILKLGHAYPLNSKEQSGLFIDLVRNDQDQEIPLAQLRLPIGTDRISSVVSHFDRYPVQTLENLAKFIRTAQPIL